MKPIGIFDSGIGGLTVARAVSEAIPGHPIVYFGDTAHLPYGEKSAELIQHYSVRIARELLDLGCGSLVVACNSASSNALDAIRETAGPGIPVIDVVTPAVNWVSSKYDEGTIGVIGTRATIASGWYQSLLTHAGLTAQAKATPLLASAIEEGFQHGRVSSALIEAYLGQGAFDSVKAIILGCTHYPLIANQIAAQLPSHIELVDSAHVVAHALKLAIQEQLANQISASASSSSLSTQRFLVSDLTESFALGAQRFYGSPIALQERKLTTAQD